VALATWRTGRPVRIVYSRAESFETTTKRHPYRIRCRAGATRDGDLTALQIDMLADTGAYASFGPGLMVKTFGSAAGPYRWPHVELHGRTVFTNNPTAGCMRGPGTTQVAFAIESQMDQLAERLGMDPLELRERNRLRQGDRLLSGQVLERDPAYAATIEAVRPHWREARDRCAGSGDEPGTLRRGVGVASIWYGIGGGGGGPVPGQDPAMTVGRGPGRAAIDLLADGSISVRTGAVDLGQGTATAMGLIAAEELGVSFERVTVRTGDTATCPDAGPTVGSRVTFFVGNAVRNAAADLREAVMGTASGLLERPFGELELCDGHVRTRGGPDGRGGPEGREGPEGRGDAEGRGGPEGRVTLSEIARARADAKLANTFEGYFDAKVPAFDAGGGLGEPYAMYVTGTQMAEVEVDTKSGAVRVLRVVAAHDVGRPVFVEGVLGQIEGGSPWAWASPSRRISFPERPGGSSSTGSPGRGMSPRWSRSSSEIPGTRPSCRSRAWPNARTWPSPRPSRTPSPMRRGTACSGFPYDSRAPTDTPAGQELRGRQDVDLAPSPQGQEVPVAAHDHVGVKGASGLEKAIACRISPDDLDHLARLDHHGDPDHLGAGRLDPIGGPAELLAEDATELGEQRPRCSDLEAPLEGQTEHRFRLAARKDVGRDKDICTALPREASARAARSGITRAGRWDASCEIPPSGQTL
jgi:hypothetical protein